MRPALAERAVRVVRSDGHQVAAELSPEQQIELYACVVHAGARGLVEVVGAQRLPDGRLRRFDRGGRRRCVEAGEGERLAALVRAELAVPRRELFVTPAALREPRGRNEAVAEAISVWVDIERPRAGRGAAVVRPPPPAGCRLGLGRAARLLAARAARRARGDRAGESDALRAARRRSPIEVDRCSS
jgi:hypothetical protein